MEDSYANYTIDPGSLRPAVELLGLIASGVAIVATVCNPAGAAAAGVLGMCTAVGVICDSLTVGSYLSEGDMNKAMESAAERLINKFGGKLLGYGSMKIGAKLTEDEMKQAEALLWDMLWEADNAKDFVLEYGGG